MQNRWVTPVSLSLVAFAILVIAWQFVHYDGAGTGVLPESCIALSARKGQELAKIPGLVPRVGKYRPGAGSWWTLDLTLPEDARVFLADMTGPTNYYKVVYYHAATYYLFPREIGVSVDRPTHIIMDNFDGRTAGSDQEMLARGYDVRLDFAAGEKMLYKALREFPLRNPANPDWFDSYFDTGIAFALPLFTLLTGMGLFRFLFPGLSGQMPLLERPAYGLALGMMAVAALTLGIKLCGFHGYHLVYLATAIGGLLELWRARTAFRADFTGRRPKLARDPVLIAIVAAGLLVFLILFRLAGLQGLVDPDAAMAWLLKAKVMHLYAGNELVQWFSSSRLSHAHLDYPTLVPSLHAATYDSLGHVDEFVTKFWPAWMLFFLMAALASFNRGGQGRFQAPGFGLLGLLLLPATQEYVQMEGGTLPMIFFTVLGFMQCAFWLVEKDRARLGLGLTLLFGAAMTKFEGFIFLALAGSWMLWLPSARPALKLSPHFWRVAAFWFLAALPFVCLRARIPVLHFESGWAGYALHHPGTTVSYWPGIFMILLARLFVNQDFASWSVASGHFQWDGRWDGISSLYNASTPGLAWLCLFMTVALWFAVPARRQVVVWILAMLAGVLAAISGVLASFASITGPVSAVGYAVDGHGGRFLLPMLVAWFVTIMTLFFAGAPASPPTPAADENKIPAAGSRTA